MKKLVLFLSMFLTAALFAEDAKELAKSVVGNETIFEAGAVVDTKDNVQKLYALTNSGFYYAVKSGNAFTKKLGEKKKGGMEYIANNSGLLDIDGDGISEMYFAMENKKNDSKMLVVYNSVPGTKYEAQIKKNGQIQYGANLKQGSAIQKWMGEKIQNLSSTATTITVVEEKEEAKLTDSGLIYVCDMWTNGKGDNKTKKQGGDFCGIKATDLDGFEVIFQKAKGEVKYITAHERDAKGGWKTSYKGEMKNLKAEDVLKTAGTTHVNFIVNGENEKYEPTAAKVRVYKKAVVIERKMPTEAEAINLVGKFGGLKSGETVLKVFVYEEQNMYKIAALTNMFAYYLIESGRTYSVYFKSQPLKGEYMLDRFNGIEDVDLDGIKDFYYSKTESKTQEKNLNLISFQPKSLYMGIGKNASDGDGGISAEFMFSANTPDKVKPWMQNKMFEFEFLKKPEEISLTDVNLAIRVWYKQNRALNVGDKEKQLVINEYTGDQNFMVSQKGLHPVIETLTVGNIEYKLYYKGVFAAYNKSTNKSYILMAMRNQVNFGTALYTDGKFVYVGLQNIGVVKYDPQMNTLSHIYPKELQGKDIWEITKEGESLMLKTDEKQPVKVPAN